MNEKITNSTPYSELEARFAEAQILHFQITQGIDDGRKKLQRALRNYNPAISAPRTLAQVIKDNKPEVEFNGVLKPLAITAVVSAIFGGGLAITPDIASTIRYALYRSSLPASMAGESQSATESLFREIKTELRDIKDRIK